MKSLEDLKKIKERALELKKLKEQQARVTITVGMATCGIAAGARETMKGILEYIKQHDLQDVLVTQTGCKGMCEHEPIVDVAMEGKPLITYGHVKAERVPQLMEQHVQQGAVINEWVLKMKEPVKS